MGRDGEAYARPTRQRDQEPFQHHDAAQEAEDVHAFDHDPGTSFPAADAESSSVSAATLSS